jgi:hydroxyacylglutathione hydrolase
MHWEVIRSGGDNLSYLLGDPATRQVAVVDPLNAEEIMARLRQGRWQLRAILLTHGHPDHTAGCPGLLEAFEIPVWSHPDEGITGAKPLEDGAELALGPLQIRALHTPGHTPGGLCFQGEDKLFSGDTIFLAGAGNCRFGGKVADLFQSFQEKILPLPPHLQLCPGHDYAENNLRFALSLDPDSPAIQAKLEQVQQAAAAGQIPFSTLAEERTYNPFFRFQEPALLQALTKTFPNLEIANPAAAFAALRELRNRW